MLYAGETIFRGTWKHKGKHLTFYNTYFVLHIQVYFTVFVHPWKQTYLQFNLSLLYSVVLPVERQQISCGMAGERVESSWTLCHWRKCQVDQQGLDSTTDQDVSILEPCWMAIRHNEMDCSIAKENNYKGVDSRASKTAIFWDRTFQPIEKGCLQHHGFYHSEED